MTHVLIVSANFYADISAEMVKGAQARLQEAESSWDVLEVPGAFEIPAVIHFAMNNKKYDGFIALGCVIRGETTHYDYVCAESARALMNLAHKDGAAIGYGILTVEDEDQAWVRAKISDGNKGKDAAEACLRMIEIKRLFDATT